MQTQKKPFKKHLLSILMAFLNPRFLLCFGLAWMITNGWCYLCLLLAAVFSWNWLAIVAGAYASLLWLPLTPEKLITLWLSIMLLKRLFPNDQKTLQTLHDEYSVAKASVKRQIARFRQFLHKK